MRRALTLKTKFSETANILYLERKNIWYDSSRLFQNVSKIGKLPAQMFPILTGGEIIFLTEVILQETKQNKKGTFQYNNFASWKQEVVLKIPKTTSYKNEKGLLLFFIEISLWREEGRLLADVKQNY